MSITAAAVNELRKKTGAGMMDCKKALQESDGDMEAAIDYLRKKGQKVSAKRADREASEGAIIALADDNQKSGVIVELNCETDFVAKNDDFVKLATDIAHLALKIAPSTKDDLLALELDGKVISDILLEQIGKIGEKIEIGSYETVSAETVVPYIHHGNRLGVLVGLNKESKHDVVSAGKDVAMQIAAMNPVALNKESVDEETIQREIEIGKEQAKAEGKPEQILEKIALGKLNKFFKDNTLLEQDFVKDSSLSIAKMLEQVENGLTVTQFKRVSLA